LNASECNDVLFAGDGLHKRILTDILPEVDTPVPCVLTVCIITFRKNSNYKTTTILGSQLIVQGFVLMSNLLTVEPFGSMTQLYGKRAHFIRSINHPFELTRRNKARQPDTTIILNTSRGFRIIIVAFPFFKRFLVHLLNNPHLAPEF